MFHRLKTKENNSKNIKKITCTRVAIYFLISITRTLEMRGHHIGKILLLNLCDGKITKGI